MRIPDSLVRAAGRIVRDVVRDQLRQRRRSTMTRSSQQDSPTRRSGESSSDYAGDFHRKPDVVYRPHPGHLPDPGEIVWAWVPYEEDHSRGKDRPVLVIGRDGDLLLAVQLTSKDHDRDAAQEASQGRYWVDIGSGDWDRERRPSEVRVDRILRLDPEAVRRVSVALDRQRFDEVAAGIDKYWDA